MSLFQSFRNQIEYLFHIFVNFSTLIVSKFTKSFNNVNFFLPLLIFKKISHIFVNYIHHIIGVSEGASVVYLAKYKGVEYQSVEHYS